MSFLKVSYLVFTFFTLSLIYSCQSESNNQLSSVDQLYKEYELQPTAEKAMIYLDTLTNFVRDNIENKSLIKPHLLKGVQVSIAQGQLSKSSNFLLPLLRLYPDLENRDDHLISLGDVMYALRKRHAASIIYKELAAKNPNSDKIISKANLIDSLANVSPDYVNYLFEQILIDPDEYGVNRNASLAYVDGVEAFALVSPKKESVPGHLYRAAEVARSMRTFPKAMSLYDWLINDYPDHEKTPTALFIKGFILEQDYDRTEEARDIYTEFLKRFPDHEMAESAQFLLNNLGKSDEEILKTIEANKAKN